MKIAMYNLTTTSRFGGVETFVWEISRELARRGEEVHIIGGKGNIQNSVPGVRIYQFPFWPRNRVPNLGTRFRKLVERWSFGICALRTVLREKYDLLHIHKPYDLLPGAAVKKIQGAKLILGSQGTDFFWGDRFLARQMDALVSCSAFNGQEVAARYGITPVIIYDGIDPQVFHPLPPEAEIGSRLALAADHPPVLMYAGRLIGWKGIDDLLRAAAILQKSLPLRVVIIGGGEALPAWQKLTLHLGIQDRVTFTGFVPNQDLPRYYSLADMGVFPSVADETFGISLCEAMACGRPVISTLVGGIPEVVQDGVTGFLVPPKDPAALAEKISRLIQDERLRQKMGEAARQRVLENFTWEKVADRLQKVYAKMGGREGNGKGR